jgi:hypothetical protein
MTVHRGAQCDGNGQVKAHFDSPFTGKTANPIDSLTGRTIQYFSLSHYSLPHLCNGEVVDHRARVPVRIQVVVCSWEWSCSSPELVQDGREVLRVGSYLFIEMGDGEISDFQLLPSLSFISLEYFVE